MKISTICLWLHHDGNCGVFSISIYLSKSKSKSQYLAIFNFNLLICPNQSPLIWTNQNIKIRILMLVLRTSSSIAKWMWHLKVW